MNNIKINIEQLHNYINEYSYNNIIESFIDYEL